MSEEAHSQAISTGRLLGLMVVQALLLAGFGFGLWLISGRPAEAFASFDAEQVVWGIAIGVGLAAVAAAVFYGFPKIAEKLVRAQAANLAFLEKPLKIGPIILISICAGVGEEALFRAGIQTLATDFMALPLAIAVSSALFALAHFAKPLIAFLIFLIGCVFGLLYWWTGSLLAVAVGHALYDVFALWYVQTALHGMGYFSSAAHTSDNALQND